MTTNSRIYLVRDKISGEKHLVDATSRSASVGAVTRDRFEVTLPSARDTALLIGEGVKVLVAAKEAELAEPATGGAQ